MHATPLPPAAASTASIDTDTDTDTDTDDRLYRRISWRLLPLLMAAYVVAYLDRVNIGYAQLQMKDALNFSTEAFGIGAGILYLVIALFLLSGAMLLFILPGRARAR